MTPKDFQDAGYKVSLQLEQSVIDSAESEVIANYIVPIVGTFDAQDADQKNALLCLSYIRICQSQIFGTRSGGKDKRVNESYSVGLESILNELGRKAHGFLEILKKKEGANTKPPILDSLGIYFKTSFFYI